MDQWLAENHDAVALAVIVLLVLAVQAPTAHSADFTRFPDVLPAGERLLDWVRGALGCACAALVPALPLPPPAADRGGGAG